MKTFVPLWAVLRVPVGIAIPQYTDVDGTGDGTVDLARPIGSVVGVVLDKVEQLTQEL